MSIVSVKSAASDGPKADEVDEFETELNNEKFCHKPFVFRILKLNLPEIKWIIIGCTTSIAFGAITPVSLHVELFSVIIFVLAIFTILFKHLWIIC
jgi:hypothetical protein